MCPTDGEGVPHSSDTGARSTRTEAEAADSRRRYRQEHAEQIAALNRSWRERHLERSRELNRESARRQRERQRKRQEKNARGRERRALNVDAERERGRRYREEHPEKVREYQRRYRERHPDRARRSAREYSQRHRDANAEEIRAKQRLAAAERRKRNPDEHREWYEKHLDEQRARGREASRLRRRLKNLGLPPSRIHRSYAEERRARDAEANEYFARRRDVVERAGIAAEARVGAVLDLPGIVAARRRAVLRQEMMPSNRDPRQWRSGIVAIPGIAQLRRKTDLQELKRQHQARVEMIRAERPQIFEHHRARREARLREEVRLDSVARQHRGLPPYDIRNEVAARVEAEVTQIINSRVEAVRRRTIRRAEEIVGRRLMENDPAAPHQVPGAGIGRGMDHR